MKSSTQTADNELIYDDNVLEKHMWVVFNNNFSRSKRWLKCEIKCSDVLYKDLQ